MLARILFIKFAVICLSQLCAAVTTSDPQAQATTLISADPKCPKGFYSGFETNTWQFTVPVGPWLSKTGSFFHSEWYVDIVNSTHGQDNTVGATRTVFFGDVVWVERLIDYHHTPTHSTMEFSLVNGPVSYGGAEFASYTEHFTAMSICGGTAVYYSMTATLCVDKIVKAYDIYDRGRRVAIQKVADELGAYVFTGSCPTTAW